jgi:hypothetical protein
MAPLAAHATDLRPQDKSKARSLRRHNFTYPMYEPSRQIIILLARTKPHYRKSTRGIAMHHLGKSKVSKLNAKAGIVYPLIRLPKSFGDEIGKIAEIFEIQHHDRRALLVTFNEEATTFKLCNRIQKLYNLRLKLYNHTVSKT